MAFRFTIGRRISFSFATLIIVSLGLIYYTYDTVSTTIKLNSKIVNIYTPSVKQLDKLNQLLTQSQSYITLWALVQSKDNQQKRKLIELINDEYPEIQKNINKLAFSWEDEDVELLQKIYKETNFLFQDYGEIMSNLNSFSSYNDPLLYFTSSEMVEDGGEIDFMIKSIKIDLTNLENRYYRKSEKIEKELNNELQKIQWIIFTIGLLMLVGGIFIAYFTTISITNPVHSLRRVLLGLGVGRFPTDHIKITNDEIGDMSAALNSLVDGMKHTKDFSREVASGNFEYEYTPMSNEDDLGIALLAMRDELKERERILEGKVEERTKEIAEQKDKIQELYKDVTDSIKYAKRLQNSILPPNEYLKELLKDYFVLYMPKDIVSGDFYWLNEVNKNEVLFGAIDCTGHGVPGAFMSLVGYNGLNQAVQEHNKVHPNDVLEDLNLIAGESLNKDLSNDFVRDGMDVALCKLNRKNLTLEYSGAKNPIYIIRDGELITYAADKISIGEDNLNHVFTLNKIKLVKNDMIYLFTDGYVDQFGGELGKKFKFSQFRKLLLSIADKEVDKQHEILYESIVKWQGDLEQLDDIMILGVRV